MEEINVNFKGIELAVVNPSEQEEDVFAKIRTGIVGALIGNRQGFTIIGPAKIIKSIKRDPNKLQILMKDAKYREKKRRR